MLLHLTNFHWIIHINICYFRTELFTYGLGHSLPIIRMPMIYLKVQRGLECNLITMFVVQTCFMIQWWHVTWLSCICMMLVKVKPWVGISWSCTALLPWSSASVLAVLEAGFCAFCCLLGATAHHKSPFLYPENIRKSTNSSACYCNFLVHSTVLKASNHWQSLCLPMCFSFDLTPKMDGNTFNNLLPAVLLQGPAMWNCWPSWSWTSSDLVAKPTILGHHLCYATLVKIAMSASVLGSHNSVAQTIIRLFPPSASLWACKNFLAHFSSVG